MSCLVLLILPCHVSIWVVGLMSYIHTPVTCNKWFCQLILYSLWWRIAKFVVSCVYKNHLLYLSTSMQGRPKTQITNFHQNYNACLQKGSEICYWHLWLTQQREIEFVNFIFIKCGSQNSGFFQLLLLWT